MFYFPVAQCAFWKHHRGVNEMSERNIDVWEKERKEREREYFKERENNVSDFSQTRKI